MSSSTRVLAALVDDDTPAYLEYGDYRGWVLIDNNTGEWIADVTDEWVASAELGHKIASDEYAVLRPVLS